MVLDPIPQSLPVHFFGSRPQPPTSLCIWQLVMKCEICVNILIYLYMYKYIYVSEIHISVTCQIYVSYNSSWSVRYMYFIYREIYVFHIFQISIRRAKVSTLLGADMYVGCQMILRDVTRRLPCTGYQTCRNVQRKMHAFKMSLSYM